MKIHLLAKENDTVHNKILRASFTKQGKLVRERTNFCGWFTNNAQIKEH